MMMMMMISNVLTVGIHTKNMMTVTTLMQNLGVIMKAAIVSGWYGWK